MYSSSYMFRHYIAIFRERFWCLLRDAQLRSSRLNIVDEIVVSSDVVRGDLRCGHRNPTRCIHLVVHHHSSLQDTPVQRFYHTFHDLPPAILTLK
jgi:hypothetical protein